MKLFHKEVKVHNKNKYLIARVKREVMIKEQLQKYTFLAVKALLKTESKKVSKAFRARLNK